jgi:hypothetical protein
MAKLTINAAAVTRLVGEISNLKDEISGMKDQIKCCYSVIREQEKLLTYQSRCMQTILSTITNNTDTPYGPLNESGPQGLIFVTDEAPGDDECRLTTSPRTPVAQSFAARNSAPTSPVLPVVESVPSVEPPTSSFTETKTPDPEPADHGHEPERRRTRPRRAAALAQNKPSKRNVGDIAAAVPDMANEALPSATVQPADTPRAPITSSLRAAAPRVVSLHVYNLSEDSTTEDVVRHVQDHMGIMAPVCQQLAVTRGNYTSFRLDVPADKVKVARNAGSWPEGVSVRFFNVIQPKQQKNSTAQRDNTSPT